jgi:hypothetical protein
VEDLGPPIAYLVLATGTPVYDRDGGRVGVVEHVLADERQDIFHGLVIHTEPLPGRHVYAHADQLAELRERGVRLSVDAGDLPEPSEKWARTRSGGGGGDSPETPLHAGMRRAWDWIRSLPPGH